MARQQKLKVYRTPIGFHDAYVAAPSQKAALEAWGSDTNLFASGAAERVEDPELAREPLANPGKVIRRARGTMAEHLAALPEDIARPAGKRRRSTGGRNVDDATSPPRKGKVAARPKPKPPPKPKPRPNRDALDRAEAELTAAEKRHEEEGAELALRQAELDRERRKLQVAHAREREGLARRLDTARAKYERAMAAWRVD